MKERCVAHLGARQQEIERRRQQSRRRAAHFLIGRPHGKRWDQREQRADDEEHDAGDHRHVIAGDRQHMRQARDVHRVVDRRGNGVAFAGDQGRRDGAAIAGQSRADAVVDAIAHPVDE